MDCFRANRGLDNTVNDVLTPLMDWSFEGGGGGGAWKQNRNKWSQSFCKTFKEFKMCPPSLYTYVGYIPDAF